MLELPALPHAANLRAVEVLLPIPMDHGFDYAVPEGLDMPPEGALVTVPFGRKQLTGMVAGAARGDVAAEKRKSLIGLAGDPALAYLPANLRELINWVAWYTLSPKGLVLKMALPGSEAMQPAAQPWHYRLTDGAKATSPQRRAIANVLADNIARDAETLASEAKVSEAVVRAFAKAGGLTRFMPRAEREAPHPPHMHAPPPLNPDQAEAARQLADKLGAGYHTCLLDGVTGSGKTEVYFDTVARALAQGKQVLVLLPEIALSLPWVARFAERFGTEPAVWHSGITPAARRDLWRGVHEDTVRLVVGARSALFLPFNQLGLIVVDEEHDASFKQEDGVLYQARDMAVTRARIEEALIVLVSATPSLESLVNAHAGRYTPVHLHARFGEAEMPKVQLVDLRHDRPMRGQFLSATLRQALLDTLGAGHQALLFLNRRGYAPLVLCRACGHRFACPHCAAWLVYHRRVPRLQCHHCGHTEPVPHTCPECKAEDSLHPYGPGVERIGEEVKALFPNARLGLMTSDALSSPKAAGELLRRIEAREIDVVVGTQMIAKGHHFPGLALVGVVDADMGLSGSDFRASERTFQLLHQVSGRAGREHIRGRVLMQTFQPEHAVMQALAQYDRDRFLALEATARADHGWPPYGRLAALIVEGPDMGQVLRHAQALAATAPQLEGLTLLGPAPAPLALLRGQHRMRLLLKTARHLSLQQLLPAWLSQCQAPRTIRVKVDIDPYSFL